MSGCFVPLRCAGFESRFAGRMEHQAVDEHLSVSLVTTCGTSAERTVRLADRAEADDIHISLQRRSRGIVAAAERSVTVAAGSVSLYATDRPYYLDYSWADQQQLIVQVSRDSLALPTGMLEDAMRRLAVPGGREAMPVHNLFAFAADLPAPGEATSVTMRDLVATMVRASFGEGTGIPRTSGGLQHAVVQFLRRHATDPRLDVELVARRHFVSRRRLYQAFGDGVASPAAILRAERVRVAQRLLEAEPTRTVESVAYASGFGDVTTLTRAFVRAHGQTPHEWRRSRAPRAA